MRKRNNNFNVYLTMLKEQKSTFTLLLSKNSQSITINEKKNFFSERKLNYRIFGISKNIKNETKDFISVNTKFRDRKDRGTIRYYHYNIIPNKLKRFYYIDISSCYISILRQKKIISKELFDKINALPKKDRLISLGMLAHEPYKIEFIEGVQQVPTRVINEYAPVFYTACYYTQQLMEKIIKLINGDFIFYWVDGIFFKDIAHYNLVKDYLKTNKFKFSFGSCYNLESKLTDNYYDISFMQKDKNKLEFKDYSIPIYFQDREENKQANELLINGNFDKLHEHFKRINNKLKDNNN